jgi:hypothetical protein
MIDTHADPTLVGYDIVDPIRVGGQPAAASQPLLEDGED